MIVVKTITNFIIDEWLYSVSHGVYHVPIAIFAMLFLFKFFLRMRLIPAVFITLIVNVGSMLLFSACAMLVAHISVYDYAHSPHELAHPLLISLGLAFIYSVLQCIFFFIISRYYTLKLSSVIAVDFLSNIFAAICVYLIPAG